MYYVYILASRKYATLYVGVMREVLSRTCQHKMHAVRGFTSRYDVRLLVWFEMYDDPLNAITRAKEIKMQRRERKISLIE
ncbi:MAG: GIY-YIG nuclease family protein [Pseudomonadota bacterium]